MCSSDSELEAFIEEVVAANDRGVSATRNVSSEPNWSFGQSLFFAGTILTTIGLYMYATLWNDLVIYDYLQLYYTILHYHQSLACYSIHSSHGDQHSLYKMY